MISLNLTFFLTFRKLNIAKVYLSKALQVKYEDVWQGPQTKLDAALLKLLTVWTAPCVIRSELKLMWEKICY